MGYYRTPFPQPQLPLRGTSVAGNFYQNLPPQYHQPPAGFSPLVTPSGEMVYPNSPQMRYPPPLFANQPAEYGAYRPAYGYTPLPQSNNALAEAFRTLGDNRELN